MREHQLLKKVFKTQVIEANTYDGKSQKVFTVFYRIRL